MRKYALLLLSLSAGNGLVTVSAATPHPSAYLSYKTVSANVLQGRNNTISGFVFGADRHPVPNIDVELLDDLDRTFQRVKTDGAGRYTFGQLPSGFFRVFVRPFGLNLQEEKKDAPIENFSRGSSTGTSSNFGGASIQVDFILRPLKRDIGPPGAVFVQEVPEAARKLYETGVAFLEKAQEQPGFTALKQSLETFPNYYLALERLGTEYVSRGYYEAGIILLTKAIEINSRSYSGYYGLGQAYFKLKQPTQAVENLQMAVNLYGESVNANMYLGMAYRQAGKLDKAEASFLKVKKLNKDVPEMYMQLALVYTDMKRYGEAAHELETLLKLNPPRMDLGQIKLTIEKLKKKATAG